MTDLVSTVGELHRRGIEFHFLTEPFDMTTAGGELFFHICAALTSERQPESQKPERG